MIEKAAPDLVRVRGIVEENIADFADELRAIDLVDLISFIRFESFPTVEDLVNTSTELFFRPETMVFSWAATVDLRWDTLPVVTIGLEFRHPDISVFFNLTIRDTDESVEILGLVFDAPHLDPSVELARAFAEARLPEGAGSPAIRPRGLRRSRRGLHWR